MMLIFAEVSVYAMPPPQYFEWIERVQEWIGRVVQAAPGPSKRKKIDIAGTSGPLPSSLDPDCLVLLKAVGIESQNDWNDFVDVATPVQLELWGAFLGSKYSVAVESLNGTTLRVWFHCARCCPILWVTVCVCICVKGLSPPWWL
jgi:hypothetical protein